MVTLSSLATCVMSVFLGRYCCINPFVCSFNPLSLECYGLAMLGVRHSFAPAQTKRPNKNLDIEKSSPASLNAYAILFIQKD